MIELIDIDNNIKFMASVITGIKYGDEYYVLYSINRDKDTYNLFVSKLVENSTGYAMDNSFYPGEKDTLDNVVASILNKDSISLLKDRGVSFFFDVNLEEGNRFSVKNCYVTTYKKSLLRECINYYDLSDIDSKPSVVVKEKEVSYFSKSNRPSIYLILLGIAVVVISIIVIISFLK